MTKRLVMTEVGVRVKKSDEVILLLVTLIAAARQKLKLRFFLNGSFGSNWILKGLNLISG